MIPARPDGLRLELDGGDPGAPAMVYLKTPRGEASATFQCAYEGGVYSLRLTARSSS
jgi:hypothetical protein